MIEKEVILSSVKGIKSRQVSQLVKKAMQFNSKMAIIYNGKKADAKSLINVMALKVANGATITISASGNDEVLAVDELVNLVESFE